MAVLKYWDGAAWQTLTGNPTTHAITHQPGGSDPMAVDAAAATGSLRTLGSGAQQAVAGNDSRLLSAAVAYGTSLPASPVDGQEAILVNSTTNPSWQWRFRYNAGSSSAYRWEFIGGSAWWVTGAPDAVLNTLTAVGASGFYYYDAPAAWQAAPRAGDYELNGFMTFDANGTAGIGYAIAFAGATTAFWVPVYTGFNPAINVFASVNGFWLAQNVSAGTRVGLGGASNAVATHKMRAFAASLTPVRVS